MREEAIYRMARAMLMDMLGAEHPRPKLRVVAGRAASEITPSGEQSVKKQRLRPYDERRLLEAAS